MKVIVGKKVYSRNENEIYQNCCVCGNELSPFAFSQREIGIDKLIYFRKANLILQEIDKDGDTILLMCKHCCKHIGLEV